MRNYLQRTLSLGHRFGRQGRRVGCVQKVGEKGTGSQMDPHTAQA